MVCWIPCPEIDSFVGGKTSRKRKMQSHTRELHNFGRKFGRRLILPLSFWFAHLERELRQSQKIENELQIYILVLLLPLPLLYPFPTDTTTHNLQEITNQLCSSTRRWKAYPADVHCVAVASLPADFCTTTGQSNWCSAHVGQPWCICDWAYRN